MQLLDWPFLDALQTGALAALFVSIGMEAVSRRDRTMSWLALACLLVGLRHTALALGTLPTMNPDLVDRAQSLLVAFGFIALCAALSKLFPHHISRRFPGWIGLGLIPNFVRNLLLSHPGFWDTWMHNAADITYLVGCGFIISAIFRARQDGDQMGKRLLPVLLVLTLPVVMEITALSLFDLKLRFSGFCLVILVMTIGNSWQWLVVNTMESRIHQMQNEVEVWRSLVPGSPFRTDHPSPEMTGLFGADWPDRIKAAPDVPMVGSDGVLYRVRSRILHHRERIGWYKREERKLPGHPEFLSGWTVGLGIDDAVENSRIQTLLRSWGAEVQNWGTIPPREGPYPSVLIWAREPSILAVWREGNLLRRRPRWIQIGGPITEGPHARLEVGASDLDIQHTLGRLLSRH
jgi:hypothetical protein